MAIEKITVTKTSASDITHDPYWNGGEIYDDAYIAHTTPDAQYEWTYYDWYLKSPSGTTIAEATEVFGKDSTTGWQLSKIFPGQTLAGNYLEAENGYRAKIVARTTPVGSPSGLTLSSTLSRGAVELAWQAGSAGTNNSVAGYDVQYRDSEDGATWPGSWQTADGSPTTALKLSVSPPETAGHYRQFRVCTRGSAGSSYDSDYVAALSLLRRKWDAFGAWEDETLTAGQSHIRAVYITQIRERIDVIRAFYGLAAYAYTPLAAGVTGIAQWAALIKELRFAVDEIGAAQSWNTLEEGKPRIAHITQLRQIIDEM